MKGFAVGIAILAGFAGWLIGSSHNLLDSRALAASKPFPEKKAIAAMSREYPEASFAGFYQASQEMVVGVVYHGYYKEFSFHQSLDGSWVMTMNGRVSRNVYIRL